jgi:hypothetical protein
MREPEEGVAAKNQAGDLKLAEPDLGKLAGFSVGSLAVPKRGRG